jgi:hypothetical protein
MPSDLPPASRANTVLALIVVALTVLTVWKVIEYRTQPPSPPPIIAPL